MRIFITGETGYISNRLYANLCLKQENYSINKKSIRNESLNRLDFTDMDIVIHTAALVHKKESKYSKDLYFDINVALTKELALKAKREKVKQFIFISTMAVFGNQEGCINSGSSIEPVTFYGQSKLVAEEAIKELEDEHFKVAIVRPPMVYGPNCPGNYTLLSKLSKKTPIFPLVENERSMIFIDNLIELIYQLIQNEESGIFHPQDPQYINTSSMVREISEVHGKSIYFSVFAGKVLKKLIGHKGLYQKVFSDLYYAKELSSYKDNSYQKYNLKQAITITEREQ
ncbi:NAD-dependent epimerase/dehydratase family protein [Lysinibacillus sp. Ag94]|uniref:NAD-dependent epimerase/dehydratase family protein n=1 Tax=Lysinibacillus sp. Ag94 TaxID=2936682 RepID=UPI00200DFD2B|nr:NAD-dependent epimerase/dehydratase family protein [Lysinibacillus sp. Ag94]UPW83711.1 NAD-dependent epimerase/dehydratase family protein [Lysinibacillus sp. Ag94]